MPDIVSFDGANRIITELDTGGDSSLSAVEIYSEWKFWSTLSDNLKFLPAFSVVGGDPVTLSESLGSTFFLENGWRIRPAERDHKLTVQGNMFTREPGESVFVPTQGDFTVSAETRVSLLTNQITVSSGSGLSAEQDAALSRIDTNAAVAAVASEAARSAGEDCRISAVYSSGSVESDIWLERNGLTVTTPLSASLSWYERNSDTPIFTAVASAPDSRGHFSVAVTQVLAPNTAYYASISVTDSDGTVTTEVPVPFVGP